MADDPILFRARAAVETATAETAELDNVRDRALRSAKAWTAMAVRAEGVERMRDRREAGSAARVAAARAAAAVLALDPPPGDEPTA